MDGITDAPMRALQGEVGAFTLAVSEFIRVSGDPIPAKVFRRDVPELASGAATPTGLAVQVQILGGHPGRMAESAATACRAGARGIDINFGCPAPTVNRHDGGASLLREPSRIREIVAEVRQVVPREIPVSAKLRLGWDTVDAVRANAEMAAEAGASWITIHARTRVQGYAPPVFWSPVAEVRRSLSIPVVANGDIWSLDDFRRCRDETGCSHFMIGRGALADPGLSHRIAGELGLTPRSQPRHEWEPLLARFLEWMRHYSDRVHSKPVVRLKQWLKFAANHGDFAGFDTIKFAQTPEEVFAYLRSAAV
jgi:tRNA-dihydrouridine synthase C